MGRQVVSWASTFILTPADPFTPFDPADPFREYRAGVDAVRFRAYPGPFSEIDIVVRPISKTGEDQITALARGKTNWLGWDFAAWGGVVFDEPAGALSLVGALGPWAVRSEFAVRSEADEVIVRGTVGVDRRFSVGGRDLYLIAEYQHDGFGAAGSEDLLDVVASDPFQRGELQVLGRDALAVQGSYQIRPLWGIDLLTVRAWRTGGVVPGASWSVTTAVGHRPSDDHELGGRERACVGRCELVGWGQFESSGWLLSRIRRRYSGSCYRDPVGVRCPAAGSVRVAVIFFLIWGYTLYPPIPR